MRHDRTWYTKDHETYDRAERAIPRLRGLRPNAETALHQPEQWAADWSGPFAHVPEVLPRTDWHLLDTDSSELAGALREPRG